MADVQDITVRYQSEVDQALADLNKLVDAQDDIIKGEKEQAKQSEKTAKTDQEVSKLRLANIKKEEAELKQLQAAKKKAFTVSEISDYNTKIAESQKRIAVLKNETSSFGLSAKNIFAGVAGGLAAAFSTEAIINFTQASVEAFLEAEKNAQRLKFAITTIGGESEVQFERLIKQSEELQKITVFSDDSIQQAQAALAAFGLTADEIENLIPKLADFATITSQDIPSAAQQIGAALEGNGREFKKYGIEVSATASRTENLSAVMEGLVQFEGAAAEATKTLTGQLEKQKNEVGDLEEKIGEGLAPAWIAVKKATYEALLATIEYFKAGGNIGLAKLKKTIDETPTAYEQIAKAADEATKKLVDAGRIEADARKEVLETMRAEILERVKLRIEQAKAANESENFTESQKRLASLRLGGVRNELTAIQKLIEGYKQANADSGELTRADVEKKSLKELNDLLEKNNKLNTVISRRNVELLESEIAKKQKLRDDEQKKFIDEYKKNLKKLADLQIANIDDEKQRRIAAFEQEVSELTSTGKLRADTIKELEKRLVKDLNAIDEKRNVDPLFRAPEQTIDQKVVLRPEMQNQVDELIKQGKTEAEAIAEVINDLRKAVQSPVEGVKVAWIDANEEILKSSLQLFGELTGIYNTFANARIEQITKQKEADISSIDEQIEANKKALEDRQITNRTEEELNKNLNAQKVEAEKKADKEIRRIRRQQAIIEKANALFQIALNTAIALSNPSNLASFGALSPLIIALAAAQSAAVIASPIPAFAKGTKGKKGSGLARVGEQGEETVFLPDGAKVLPNRQTKMFSGLIDAMYDMNPEKYIYKHYVTPALMAQKREHESKTSYGNSFAQNVAKAAPYQSPTKINIPSSYTMSNTDELAEKIASRLTVNRRRL